jgi:ectoine hydroxylase-related dioxygenase (phytanoyl-CoA dioxygenase family)
MISNATTPLVRLVDQFRRDGFVVMPDVLTPAEVMRINTALDSDLSRQKWPLGGGDGRQQDADILPRLDALDLTLDHPAIMPLVRALVGEHVTLDEVSVMFRDPVTQVPDQRAWHRDFGRDEAHPLGLHALSVIYYLSDVTSTDHCFTLAAGTHDRWRDVQPQKHNPLDEFEVNGPAGTAVFFHTHCLHTATIKRHSTQRRTLHLYYGSADKPAVSRFTRIPARMAKRTAAHIPPQLYCRADAAV